MGIVIPILLFVSKFVIKEPNVLILTKNRISHLRNCVQLNLHRKATYFSVGFRGFLEILTRA